MGEKKKHTHKKEFNQQQFRNVAVIKNDSDNIKEIHRDDEINSVAKVMYVIDT